MVAALANQTAPADKTRPVDPQNSQTNPVDPQNSQANPQANPAVGAGVTGASLTASVPPAPGTLADPTVSHVDLGAAFASLLKFLPTHDDAEVKIAIAMGKLSEMQQRGDNEQIKVHFAKRQEVSAAKLAAAKDMEEQLKSIKGTGFWDVIKVVCAVVVSVLAIVASGGTAGVLLVALLASGIAGLIGAADTALQMRNDGHGIAGNVCLHVFNGSEEDAKKADMVFGIVLGAVQLVAGIVALAVGDPNQVAAGWSRLSLAIGGAGASVGAAVVNYQNAGHQAEAKRDRAREQIAQATLDELDAFVQQIIKRMTTNLGNWGRIQEDVTATLAEKNYQTARVRFA